MKVKVKLDKHKINKLTSAQLKAGKMTAEQMLSEIVREQKIPFDEGTLQNVQTFVEAKDEEIKIAHDTPYAQRLYYNPQYNFDKTININAGGEWWEDWLVGSKANRPIELFKQFYKMIGGV